MVIYQGFNKDLKEAQQSQITNRNTGIIDEATQIMTFLLTCDPKMIIFVYFFKLKYH